MIKSDDLYTVRSCVFTIIRYVRVLTLYKGSFENDLVDWIIGLPKLSKLTNAINFALIEFINKTSYLCISATNLPVSVDNTKVKHSLQLHKIFALQIRRCLIARTHRHRTYDTQVSIGSQSRIRTSHALTPFVISQVTTTNKPHDSITTMTQEISVWWICRDN